jgi:GxxExxY protein
MDEHNNDDGLLSIICKDLSFQVLAAVFEVHNTLGPGFLEAVYEKALLEELQLRGFLVESQKEIRITYKGTDVGAYYPDIVVENQIILELKTVEKISGLHEAQLLHYLKATGMKLGMVINFAAERVQYKRLVL